MQISNEKIAMGQIVAMPTIEENLEQYSNMIDEAAEKGAKLILFPEVGFYPFFHRDILMKKHSIWRSQFLDRLQIISLKRLKKKI